MRLVAILAVALACRAEPPAPTPTPTPTPPAPVVAIDAGELNHPAIGDLSTLAPELRRAFEPAEFYAPLHVPGPNDWLAQHSERPQTYADFVGADTPVPGPQRKVIYLLPLGEFPPDAPKLAPLAEVVHAFYALEVRALPAVPLAEVVAKVRIHPGTKKKQLLAPDVLAWLTKRLPPDAFGLMAVTMVDLYPEPAWNFVFGMASLRERVGVQSFARQDPAFLGERSDPALAQRRATWTIVHELAHMFGITHCVHYRCVANGANNQTEADGAPLHPCPVCLRKLHSAIGFDPLAREEALATVLRAQGMDDEAVWAERRAAWIRDGTRAP